MKSLALAAAALAAGLFQTLPAAADIPDRCLALGRDAAAFVHHRNTGFTSQAEMARVKNGFASMRATAQNPEFRTQFRQGSSEQAELSNIQRMEVAETAMVKDIYENYPSLGVEEAYSMAVQACGWPSMHAPSQAAAAPKAARKTASSAPLDKDGCKALTQDTWGLAHARNVGYPIEREREDMAARWEKVADTYPNAPADFTRDLNYMRSTEWAIMEDLWSHPTLTPDEAARMVSSICGWRKLPSY